METEALLNIAPISIEGCMISILCGLLIGFERQWSGKPAGIRTSILICLSAYTFIAVANYFQPDAGAVRTMGQIVTGVGFLGAGVIIAREGLVLGVTSAAVIWILAAIGCLVGFGSYASAIWLALLAVAVLIGINMMEKGIVRLRRGVHRVHKDQEEPR